MKHRVVIGIAMTAFAVLAAACTPPPDPAPDPDVVSALEEVLDANPEGCEFLEGRSCLLPFPSDHYTVADTATATGRRLALSPTALTNAANIALDPTEWARQDGFSPSTPIIAHLNGADPNSLNLPNEGAPSLSMTAASSTAVIDLATGERVPHLAEFNLRATTEADQTLIIRPLVSLREGGQFAVSIHGARADDGSRYDAPIGFRVYRDGLRTEIPRVEARRAEFNEILAATDAAGVPRHEVNLAWRFTVASADSLAGRVLHMRDEAFAALGADAPNFVVTSVNETGWRDGVAHVVEGTFTVPLYLDNNGQPGSRMAYEPGTSTPVQTGEYQARFLCTVPESALRDGGAAPVVYGHGLLGSLNEARSSQVQQTTIATNAVYCGTNWIGISSEDQVVVAGALSNANNFSAMTDRMQQSLLNFLFLGRLLKHTDGFASHEAFQMADGTSALQRDAVYYDGNSQGAIMGGAVTAIAQDWTKAVLGVGGMNYSTLLNRSVDFDAYSPYMEMGYPNKLDQQLFYGLIQMLWDRGETSGYVQHLGADTYHDTPEKQVVMAVGYGDHQVATITAEAIARTLDWPIYQPAMSSERLAEIAATGWTEPFWGLRAIDSFPTSESALFIWDSGTLAPPIGNITPRMGDLYTSQCPADPRPADVPVKCKDPHEDPRRDPKMFEQKAALFQPGGQLIDACEGAPCTAQNRQEYDY